MRYMMPPSSDERRLKRKVIYVYEKDHKNQEQEQKLQQAGSYIVSNQRRISPSEYFNYNHKDGPSSKSTRYGGVANVVVNKIGGLRDRSNSN